MPVVTFTLSGAKGVISVTDAALGLFLPRPAPPRHQHPPRRHRLLRRVLEVLGSPRCLAATLAAAAMASVAAAVQTAGHTT